MTATPNAASSPAPEDNLASASSNSSERVVSSAPVSAAATTTSRAVAALTNENTNLDITDETSVAARRLRHLSQIGLALSAERDIRRLLAMILSTSRELTSADGGTLYIVETDPKTGEKSLFFRASQNDSIIIDTNMSFAVSATSLAGYAALSGEILRFDDVYHLPPDAPYAFNSRFDVEHGYRTKSVLVVPMQNHVGEIIGVLQLINRKRRRDFILRDNETAEREVIGFTPDLAELAATLASQAAVALNNNLLLREIEVLFESFVIAASTAIEDRDPTTSGHSQRVTKMTLALARAINDTNEGPYRDVHFSSVELRELRYAALLHDFGKIGVREAILTKSHKIELHAFETILNRIKAMRATWQAQSLESRLEIALDASLSETIKCERIAAEAERCNQQIAQLDADTRLLEQMNDPARNFIPDEMWGQCMEMLDRLTKTSLPGEEEPQPLLTPEERVSLEIRRGTLTFSEFAQIKDHAQMSRDFLIQIPWTRELAGIPPIAHAHHERNDGSGYPLGLKDEQIPLGAKLMAIADVYDALTASDRPYKRSMPTEVAIEILRSDAKAGKLDNDLLDIFVNRQVWQASLS